MATLQTVRLRAGFYVTRDAQWRIVRRRFLAGQVTHWYVELWDPRRRNYTFVQKYNRLDQARRHVEKALLAAQQGAE